MANPVSIALVEKVQEILQTITIANGYQQDVYEVRLFDDITEEVVLPSITVATTADNYTNLQGGWQHNELSLTAMAFQDGLWDMLPRVHRLWADMHKALQGAFVASGSWGADRWDGLAVLYRPLIAFPFTDHRHNADISGVQFDFQVQYRHAELDPYTAP